MNLHEIASAVTSMLFPSVSAQLVLSDGYVVDPDTRRQVPLYADPITVLADVQELTFSDVQRVDNLNLQNVSSAAYLTGQVAGLSRLGGTVQATLTFADDPIVPEHLRGWIFNVGAVMEQWPEWCKVALTRRERV
jgi:hypothetical protein